MKNSLYQMLFHQAIADKKKALLSLELLSDNAVGIGDHSTEDFWSNANEALELLVSADDRIATLTKYFPEEDVSAQSTLF